MSSGFLVGPGGDSYEVLHLFHLNLNLPTNLPLSAFHSVRTEYFHLLLTVVWSTVIIHIFSILYSIFHSPRPSSWFCTMRIPELWVWLNGVPGPKFTNMLVANDHHLAHDIENVTNSDRSYFSLSEQAVIPRPSPAIFASTPEPSTGPASTASIGSSANLLNVLQHTNPPIYFDRDVRLPEFVRALRERLVKNFGHGVIPKEFKVCTPYGIWHTVWG